MKVLANFEDNHKIPSNSSLDDLLDGGFEKGTITQIYGSPSSGKSNVALALAVNVAKNNRKVIYIDTEGGISIDRIKQISGPYFSNVANNIIVLEPTNFLEQTENLRSINVWLRKHHEDVDLIILDSAVALYRVDDMKSYKLSKELRKQIQSLSNTARNHDIVGRKDTLRIPSFYGKAGHGPVSRDDPHRLRMQQDFHAVFPQHPLHGRNHVRRVVRHGEDTSAPLRFGRKPPPLKAGDDIVGSQPVSGAVQKPRIGQHMRQKFFRRTVIRKITSSFSGNKQFLAQFFIVLCDCHPVAQLRCISRAEHTGGAAASNHNFTQVSSLSLSYQMISFI